MASQSLRTNHSNTDTTSRSRSMSVTIGQTGDYSYPNITVQHNQHSVTPVPHGQVDDTPNDPFLFDTVHTFQTDLIYLCSIFLAGAIVRHATEVLHIPLPYTVVVFFVGVMTGYLPLGSIAEIGPHSIIYIFLPVLIFEGAFAIDVYVFKQIIFQVLTMAAPALVVMIVLLAITAKYIFKYQEWTWTIALLFGSILSATDPVAVVAIMKELGTSKQLSLLIEGESMLNDGTAMVFFEFFKDMVDQPDFLIADSLTKMVWISIGGVVFGYIMAKVAIFWLQWTFNDSLTEIAITLSMAYLVFYIADAHLKVSAVLAVVALGATLSENRTSISPEVEVFLHSFWETLAFMANTLIFAICGFIITRKVIVKAGLEDFIYLIILYFAVQVTRGLTFMLFSPLLKRLGYGLSWQDALVSAWSGLRGAVGLALALIIFKDDNPVLANNNVGGKMLFHVSLIVVFTLLINATTVSHLLTFLGLTDVTPARRYAMKKAIRILDDSRHKTMRVWKIDRFLADADWEIVDKNCMIEDPFTSSESVEEKEFRERQDAKCPRCGAVVPYIPSQSELRVMLAEALRKYLKLLKQNFWLQFERGLLAGFSVRKLTELAEEAADRDCEMIEVKEIKSMWQTPQVMTFLKRLVSRHTVCYHPDVLLNVMNSASIDKITFYLVGQSQLLVLGIYGMDAAVTFTTHMLVLMLTVVDLNIHVGMQNANMLMSAVSVVYLIFRVWRFHHVYFHTLWFFVNSLCLTISAMETLVIFIMFRNNYGMWALVKDENEKNIILSFLILRGFRYFQLIELCSSIISFFYKRKLRHRLTTGCDIGRGFVRANELAIRLVDDISDNELVQSVVKSSADNARMHVLRELGLLQGLHPDIALGVKTCQAVRSVLNVMREGMHQLIDEGGIDETEGLLFIKVIESKMKRLMAAPPKLEIPSTKKILSAIPWVDRDRKLVDFIHNLAEKKIFTYGETIMKVGDMPTGIYIIVSGLVKVEVPMTGDSDTNLQAMSTIDFLSTGNVIGEISVLTEKARTATLTCETLVKTLFLSTNNLKITCLNFNHLDPPLISRLWKICAVRISLNLLASVPSFHGMRKEAMLARLENAELDSVDESDIFEIGPQMLDVILIIGRCVDGQANELYTGPCYIPKTVSTLIFEPNQMPRPLVFYTEKLTLNSSGGATVITKDLTGRSVYDMRRFSLSGLQTQEF